MKCLEGQYHKSIRAFIPSWLDATPEALGPCRFNLDEPACLAHVWEQGFKQNHSLPPPLAPTPRRCWRKSNGDQSNAMQNLRTSINTSSVSEPRRAAHKLRVAASVLPASWCMSRRPLVIRSASVNDSRRHADNAGSVFDGDGDVEEALLAGLDMEHRPDCTDEDACNLLARHSRHSGSGGEA